jgi:hypothetical protein
MIQLGRAPKLIAPACAAAPSRLPHGPQPGLAKRSKTAYEDGPYWAQVVIPEEEETMSAPLRSGSRVESERVATSRGASSELEREWQAAEATDRQEAEHAAKARARHALSVVVPAAVVAAVLPAIFPLMPGFSAADTLAAVIAAAVTATIAIGVVPLTDRLARGVPRAGAGESLVIAAALLSAGAAAIHFAVAKAHFDEYTLFGLFFVGSGIAQLVWPIWVLFRRWSPLFLLAAVGNAAIVSLWAVDRIWGLPLGPTPWKPDPVGFGDSVTAAFEVLLVAACVAILVRGRGARMSRATVLAMRLAVTALTAVSLLSVLGVGSSFLRPTE